MLDACKNADYHVIDEYIEMQYDIDDQNDKGWMPLIVASYHGNLEAAKKIVQAGADVNKTNYNGTTPLMYAKEYALKTGDYSIMQLLILMGADLNQRDYRNKTLSDYIEEQYGYLKRQEVIERCV